MTRSYPRTARGIEYFYKEVVGQDDGVIWMCNSADHAPTYQTTFVPSKCAHSHTTRAYNLGGQRNLASKVMLGAADLHVLGPADFLPEIPAVDPQSPSLPLP